MPTPPTKPATIPCPACNGHGGLLYEPGCVIDECWRCKGSGRVEATKGEPVFTEQAE